MGEQIEKEAGRKHALYSRLWFVPLLVLAVAPIVYGSDEYHSPRKVSYPYNLIRTIQVALHQQGLDPGEIDGLWGPKTRAALAEFQREESLPMTGQPDANTVAHLLERHRQEIQQLQQRLASEGFDDYLLNGGLGPVPVWVLDPPQPVDGELSPVEVWDAIHQLQQYLASEGFDETPVDGEFGPVPVEVSDPPQ